MDLPFAFKKGILFVLNFSSPHWRCRALRKVCRFLVLLFLMGVCVFFRMPSFRLVEKTNGENVEGYFTKAQENAGFCDGVDVYRSYLFKPFGIIENNWIVENPKLSKNTLDIEKGTVRNIKISGICNDSKIRYSIDGCSNVKINKLSYNEYSLEGTSDGVTSIRFCVAGREFVCSVRVYHECVGEWVVTEEPSCERSGSEEEICVECGKVISTRELPALGHNYVDCVCENCYKVRYLDEASKSVILSEKICRENGIGLSETVVIPSHVFVNGEEYKVTGLGTGLFNENTDVTRIVLPDTIRYLADFVCNSCSNLKSIEMQDGVLYIGKAAFQCCYALESIEIPDSVEYIGDFAYNHCSGATNSVIELPSSLVQIGRNSYHPAHAFYDCGKDRVFTAFSISSENEYYRVEEGILYTKDGKTLVSIPRGWGSEGCTYTMPDTVEYLGELSFSRNKNIKTVVISDGLSLYNEDGEGEYLNQGNELSVGCYYYSGVEEYVASENSNKYSSKDGILYSADGLSVVAVPTWYSGDVVIPEGVCSWCEDAMWDRCEVNGVIRIPSSLVEINEKQMEILNDLVSRTGTRIVVSEKNPVYTVNSAGFLEKN